MKMKKMSKGLGLGAWGLVKTGAGAALFVVFWGWGCARGSAPSAAQRAAQDVENLRQAKILRDKAAALQADFPALAEELAQIRGHEARLTLRQQARNNGRYHLVLDDDGARLRFFNGSRPIGVLPLSRIPVPGAAVAASAPVPPPAATLEFAPGAYRLRRIETLKTAQPGPRVPGRKATAGGNCRLYFGDANRDLWFISTARAPNQPPAPKLPRWNISSGALDSLAAALKPDDPLYIPAVGDLEENINAER